MNCCCPFCGALCVISRTTEYPAGIVVKTCPDHGIVPVALE